MMSAILIWAYILHLQAAARLCGMFPVLCSHRSECVVLYTEDPQEEVRFDSPHSPLKCEAEHILVLGFAMVLNGNSQGGILGL